MKSWNIYHFKWKYLWNSVLFHQISSRIFDTPMQFFIRICSIGCTFFHKIVVDDHLQLLWRNSVCRSAAKMAQGSSPTKNSIWKAPLHYGTFFSFLRFWLLLDFSKIALYATLLYDLYKGKKYFYRIQVVQKISFQSLFELLFLNRQEVVMQIRLVWQYSYEQNHLPDSFKRSAILVKIHFQ